MTVTAMDVLCPAPPVVGWPRPDPEDVALRTCTQDVTRVLVVGGDRLARRPGRVPWALTQVWRRAGRPLLVRHGPGAGWVCWWARQHEVAGVRCEPATPGCAFDVIVAFTPTSSAMTWALQVARRSGLDVVDGARAGELR